MEIINISRQAGKTTKVIEAMKRNPNALMLTFSEMEKSRIEKLKPNLRGRVMSISEYQKEESYLGKRFNEIHIDNLELCLKIGHRIGIITMTNYPTRVGVGEYVEEKLNAVKEGIEKSLQVVFPGVKVELRFKDN